MMVVWKLTLTETDQIIEIPEGAEILMAGGQRGFVCVWFLCDSENPKTKRFLTVSRTGWAVPTGSIYLGTAFLNQGELVLHVFERGTWEGKDYQ